MSVVSEHSIAILKATLRFAGEADATITSTARTPYDQAVIMYDNIETYGVKAQKKLYAGPGDKVIDVYVEQKAAGKTRDEVIAAMEAKIIELGPSRVSRHCADPAVLGVVDIDPRSITNTRLFETALRTAKKNGDISEWFGPKNGDPAYHIEVPQVA